MITAIGSSVNYANLVKDWFEELGLADVEEKVVTGNYGTRDDKDFEAIAKRAVLVTANSTLGVISSRFIVSTSGPLS